MEVFPVPRGPAEQERVGQSALADRAHQRPDHVLLPQDLVGTLGTVPAIEGLVLLLLGQRCSPRSAVPLAGKGARES